MADPDVLAAEIRAMREDMHEVKLTMRQVADALVQLARLEERHTTVAAALDRAFAAISKIEGRVRSLETAQPVQKLTSSWMIDAAKFLAGGVVATLVLRLLAS
jgi:hypothetical protein